MHHPRGVHRALADTYVPAAINVEAVPVGVYFQIQNRQMIHSGSQQGEMPQCSMDKSFRVTFLQSFRLIALLPTPGRRLSSRFKPLP